MLTPQFLLPLADEIVVDLFAGGGGASCGIEEAIGRQLSKAAQVRMCGNSVCPPLAAALYSTGAVMIEAGGQQVHLPRDSARGLLAWLLKIDQAVQA